jgi:WD40 repeat protein
VVQVEKIIAIYNARKRFVAITRFKPHSHTFNDIAWSKRMATAHEQQLLATCGKDGTIRLWKAKDIMSKKLRNEEEAEEPYMELGVFQDPCKLYNRPNIDGDGHVESVVCVSFDTQDKYIVSGGVDYRLLLWDIQKGRFVHEFEGLYICY